MEITTVVVIVVTPQKHRLRRQHQQIQKKRTIKELMTIKSKITNNLLTNLIQFMDYK